MYTRDLDITAILAFYFVSRRVTALLLLFFQFFYAAYIYIYNKVWVYIISHRYIIIIIYCKDKRACRSPTPPTALQRHPRRPHAFSATQYHINITSADTRVCIYNTFGVIRYNNTPLNTCNTRVIRVLRAAAAA